MTDSPAKFDKYAKGAMESINEYGLTASPRNYEIWYAYHSGDDVDLAGAIDVSISSNREIDAELMRDLYEQYFTENQQYDNLTGASAKLELVVSNVIDRMQTANEGAGEFGGALEVFSDGLNVSESSGLHDLVTSILLETRKIDAQNTKLQSELNSYSNEVSKLREDLEFVRNEARTDALTGLANRKYFDSFIDEAVRDAVENSEKLTLLIADVDNFKSFNDTYGHQLGDQVLKVVADILQDNSKGRDLAARYGGEEFCVILPATKMEHGAILANQMRERVAAKKIVKKSTGKQLRQITMSFGVSEFRYDEPIADLISRADKAMYWAKQNGRNLVATETDLENINVPVK